MPQHLVFILQGLYHAGEGTMLDGTKEQMCYYLLVPNRVTPLLPPLFNLLEWRRQPGWRGAECDHGLNFTVIHMLFANDFPSHTLVPTSCRPRLEHSRALTHSGALSGASPCSQLVSFMLQCACTIPLSNATATRRKKFCKPTCDRPPSLLLLHSFIRGWLWHCHTCSNRSC